MLTSVLQSTQSMGKLLNFFSINSNFFRLEDPAVIMDLINMMICTSKIENVSIDFSTTLIKKARSLIASNYMVKIYPPPQIYYLQLWLTLYLDSHQNRP